MKIFLPLIFLSLSLFCRAQSSQNDILKLQSEIANFEKLGDVQSEGYANSLIELASLYFNIKEYIKVEDPLLKVIKNYGGFLEDKHPFIDKSIRYLAILYQFEGKYSKAEPLLLRILEIDKEILGEKHPNYISSLVGLAKVYQNQGKFAAAENLLLNALTNIKEVSGENNPNYASCLTNLASLYLDEGDYLKVEPLYLKALNIRKEILGEKHPLYATSMNNLAMLYIIEGRYSEALPLLTNALSIRKEVLGEKNIDYAIYMGNLGMAYFYQGRYTQAEPLLLKSLAIKREILGEKTLKYAAGLSDLAELYKVQGKYSEAEVFIQKALSIKKENLGEKNSDYAISLGILASLYSEQGNFSKAEPLLLKVSTIRKEVLGDKHPDYATAINNLATLYLAQEKYSEVEPLYLKVLTIRKEALGENHPSYAKSLNNLAQLYSDQGEYSKAEEIFLQSIASERNNLKNKNASYAIILRNLALLYFHQDKFSKAELLLLEALKIQKEILGDNHPDYISTLEQLALIYTKLELNGNASIYFEKYIKANQIRLAYDIYNLSETELLYYVKYTEDRFSTTFAFLNDFSNLYPELKINLFVSELLFKNLSLRNQEQIKIAIQKRGNSLLQSKYEQFLFNKRQQVKLMELPLEKRSSSYESLTEETEKLEKELAKESTTFADFKKSMTITFGQIKDKLKNEELVINIVSYKYYGRKPKDSLLYSAFIIGKNYKFPKFITLFEEKQLQLLLSKFKKQEDSLRIDKQYLDKAISDLFLKPLEKELEGISTIYLSPSGLGHQINFAALPVNDNQTLGNTYKLHLLSSPAELIDYSSAKFEKVNNLELLLYGGIDYDKVNSIPKTNIVKTENNSSQTELQTRSGITGFGYLKGSKKEVEQISFKGVQSGFKTTLLNDRAATEESIKQLDGRTTPFILHLATHGFFFPDPIKEAPKNIFDLEGKSKIYKASDDPMMRSGLLFSGANKFWGKTTENTTTEDGILTASEISNLDLSACQLVVLSACETGLGEVKGSEGVFGLQRAFKMAGVKNIIMSLWKVPDAQTAELFEIFYAECFAGKTIHQAFQSAQTKMKAKYSPYYWAGFVLLE